METFGQRLEAARRRKLMTQLELAHAAGIGIVTVSRLENDHGTSPRTSTVKLLAQALEVDPAWLLFGEEPDMGKAAA